ncbi:MAG TPA: glycine oxidase ThiO [Polyangia bacterium]
MVHGDNPSRGAADVVVVGAGVMGCAVALRLAQRGVAVTIIERGIPGAEASSAAAGILGPQWESEGPGPLLELGLRSRALYPAFAAELRELSGIDISHVRSGLIELALDDSDVEALAGRRTWQTARGLRAELLTGDQVRELEPQVGPAIRSGLRYVGEGHVHARLLARALSQAAAVAGARFVQGRYVRRVITSGNRVTGVELDGETLSAGKVVVCAGSWSSLVEGGGVPAPVVRPARGQMVAIETRPPLFRHVLVAHRKGYLVPRADGVALAGSTLEMVGYRKEVTVAGLADILGLARTMVPSLGEAPVVETWANFRPLSPDGLPIIGKTPIDGLLLATGHHRYGILLTPITAQVISELALGGESSVDLTPFAVTRFVG